MVVTRISISPTQAIPGCHSRITTDDTREDADMYLG